MHKMIAKQRQILYLLAVVLCTHSVFFCKNFQDSCSKRAAPKNIVILFHLYNLDLMDDFIERINKFIELNSTENFHIKITIPIGNNVALFDRFDDFAKLFENKKNVIYQYSKGRALYHPQEVTFENCIKLFLISEYLLKKLVLSKNKVQIIFSENRGVDVGSFLLMLDQVIAENLLHDYIVKIHTKTDKKWREKLLKILDFKFSENNDQFACIYGCHRLLSKNHANPRERRTYKNVLPKVRKILDFLHLECPDAMNHCAGTMFIVSSELTTFFKKYNRLQLYNKLNMGFPKGHFPLLEHGLEVSLGYICDYLQLKRHVLSDFLADKVL